MLAAPLGEEGAFVREGVRVAIACVLEPRTLCVIFFFLCAGIGSMKPCDLMTPAKEVMTPRR